MCIFLLSKEGDTYIGSTPDLKRRVQQHQKGLNRSTKGKEWQLIYYEAYASKLDAILRERKLKHRGQAKRLLKMRLSNSLKLACGSC